MRVRLSRRDIEFIARIVPYGHVTLSVMQRWYPHLSQMALRSWVKRLRQSGWLISASLDERRNYYRLTNKSVKYLRQSRGIRVSRAATRPLKPNRKPEKHAWLLFISADAEGKRQAYRPAFDSARFPDLAEHLATGKADPYRQRLFYLSELTIGLFTLDRGNPDFVQAKLKPQVEALWQQSTFSQIVRDGHFELTVATCSESRKRELEAEMDRCPPGFRWQIVVMEEIAALLPRRGSLSQEPHSTRED